MKRFFGILRRVLSAVITVILIGVFFLVLSQKISGELPSIMGYHLMYVLTGSMSPELKAGDAIVIRDTEAAELRIGDIICYESTEGEMAGRLITHRVDVAPYEEDGVLMLRTKGDANPAADNPIEGEQVVGRLVLKLPVLGRLYKFFCTVPGLIVVSVPIMFMMVMEVRSMVVCVEEDIAETVKSETRSNREDQK